MTERVYLHIGPPKTGTSYIQQALWASKPALASSGVLVPGDHPVSHKLAAWDFFGRRPEGADMPVVKGSWQALVDQVGDWSGRTAVVSEESLTAARGRQVRRMVRSFAPADVHVVVTTRDLARIIPGAWQQHLQMGSTQGLAEFVAALRDPERASPTALLFWLKHDLQQVLSAWEGAVPRERIHVVTVPAAGSAPRLLLERFAQATDLEPGDLQAGEATVNEALGVVEAEVLRRLNNQLGGRLNERQYRRTVHFGVLPPLRDRPGRVGIVLPDEHRAWARECAQATADALAARGYPVSGDLKDLVGGPEPEDGPLPVADTALEDSLVLALAGITEHHAKFWWRHRRADRPAAAGGGAGLASQARAATFRLKSAVVRAGENNRWVARTTQAYLRRATGRR